MSIYTLRLILFQNTLVEVHLFQDVQILPPVINPKMSPLLEAEAALSQLNIPCWEKLLCEISFNPEDIEVTIAVQETIR